MIGARSDAMFPRILVALPVVPRCRPSMTAINARFLPHLWAALRGMMYQNGLRARLGTGDTFRIAGDNGHNRRKASSAH